MKATVIVLSSLAIMLWVTAPLGAQQDSTPYQSVVTGSNVYVRSGPSMGSYPVAQLSAPDRVTVVEKLSNDWLAIQPVPGCYGVVSVQYVQPDATGKIGTITGDGVLIRAAGELRKKEFTNPLGKRNRGDRVRILGRVVDSKGQPEWYIIKPPSDMRFYISAQFVRSADGTEPTEPAKTPTTPQTPTAAPSPTPPSQAAVGAPVRQELDALRTIRALEKELVAESAKPVDQRNFANILGRAEKIKLPPNSRFIPIYDSLMQYLREEVALVEKARATDKMVDDILRRAAEKRTSAAKETEPAKTPKTPEAEQAYDIEGILAVSALYSAADPGQPRRYAVRHPQTKSVVGYVQSSGGKVKLDEYEGMNVGIRGRMIYDEAISRKILEVDSVTPLDESAVPKKPAPKEMEPAEPEPTEPAAEEPSEPAEPEPAEEAEPVEPAEKTKPTQVEPEPAEEEPAESVEPEPTQPEEEPEPLEPGKSEPTEPKPAEEEPLDTTEPEEPAETESLEPTKVEPLKPTEAEPATPVEEPQSPEATEPEPEEAEPLETVEPEPEESEPTRPESVKSVPAEEEPLESVEPEPVEEEPLEPEEIKPATPVEEPESPEPVTPETTEPEPAEPTEAKPVTTVEEPESPEPESVEPESVDVESTEPKPVKKKTPAPEPAAVESVESEPVKSTEPTQVKPAEIKPMEIEPVDVKPAEIESPALPTKAKSVKTTPPPSRSVEPKPMPADQIPDPDEKMFEVETTEGDIEVEWD